MEYPFFAIGELIKAWVTEVNPGDKRVSITLVNYDEGVFTDDLPSYRGYGISPYGTADYGVYNY
jgi:hypothetical protein